MKPGLITGVVLALLSLNTIAQQSITDTPGGGTQPTLAGPHQERPPARPEKQERTRFLTNAEVVRMVKAGVEEDAILASIHSSHCRFDLAPEALLALHKDGVNETILTAMMEADAKNHKTPGEGQGKTAGTGQELAKTAPDKKRPKPTPEQLKQILAKLKAKHSHPGETKSSPKSDDSEPKVAALKQQKQAVQSGQVASANGGTSGGGQSTPHGGTPAAAGGTAAGGTGGSNPSGGTLLSGSNGQTGSGQSTPPAGTPGAGGGTGSNPNGGGLLASGNNPSGAGKNTPPAGTPGAGGNNPTGGSTPGGGNPPSTHGSQPAGQRTAATASKSVMSTAMLTSAPITAAAPPANPPSRSMIANNSMTSIDPCLVSTMGPIIKGLNSSGSYGPAVFTQDPTYNPFWVIGCHFGNTQGQAYLNSSTGQKLATLRVNSWTDTLVKVTIDPYLVDVFDQDNVTLVIAPPTGQSGQKGGFSFYALRKEVLLTSIPQSQVNVAPITDTGGFGVMGYFTSPYRGFGYDIAVQAGSETAHAIASNNASLPISGQGWTAGVDRNGFYRFGPGTDVFNFTQLKPGFGVSRFQIHEWTEPFCNSSVGLIVGDETDYVDGTWNAQLNSAQQQIQVAWQEEHCHTSDVSVGSDSSNSAYALQVWVAGPAMAPNESPWQPGLK